MNKNNTEHVGNFEVFIRAAQKVLDEEVYSASEDKFDHVITRLRVLCDRAEELKND